MSTVIIAGGSGRSAIRRFELANNDASLSAEQVNTINDKLDDLFKLADNYGCPDDDGCWPVAP